MASPLPGGLARRDWALWDRGFRPFFLLSSTYGPLLVLFWLAILAGWIAPPAWLDPIRWHAHEMLFGFATASVAGFLLSSVPVWTSSQPVVGGSLAALAGLWLAGRVALALAGALPAPWVAVLDLAFLPALAVVLARPLVAARQRRNYGFALILAGLAVANSATHLQNLGVLRWGAAEGLRFAVAMVALLVVVVAGRITPAFTANAFRRVGKGAAVRSRPGFDRLAVLSVVLFAAVDLAAPRTIASGAVALAAAAASAVRMSGWQSLRTGDDPLVWSLHLSYAWIALGLALIGVGDLTGRIPWASGLHALTAGGFGSMILAVMTRVALGHTGRPLVAPPGIPLAYALITLGAVVRVASPMWFAELGFSTLAASGALWSAGFGIFLWVYGPILLRARVDGRPG